MNINSDIGVDDLIVSTQKAREYAYLGMYEEAVYHFRKSIIAIQDKIKSLGKEPKLRFEYDLLLDEVSNELNHCNNQDKSIRTGDSKKVEESYSKKYSKNKTLKNNDNNDKKEEDNKLPFGKIPFQHHKPKKSKEIQENPKKKYIKQKSDISHQVFVPERKAFNMSTVINEDQNLPYHNHGISNSAHHIDYKYNKQNIPPFFNQNLNNSYDDMYQHLPEYINNANQTYQQDAYQSPYNDQVYYNEPNLGWMNNPYPQAHELPKKKKSTNNAFGNQSQKWNNNYNGDNIPQQKQIYKKVVNCSTTEIRPQTYKKVVNCSTTELRPQTYKSPPTRMSFDNQSPINPKREKKSGSMVTKSNINVKALENKRNTYEKPWLSGLEHKNSNDKRKDNDQFLNHVYPGGRGGPDEDQIKMLEKEVIERSPGITFEDIAELDRAKEILFETVIYPMLMPKFYQGIRKPRKGVLLFGPPGTGKTMQAKALATTSDTTFFNVSPSTLASKWKGDSEKLVRLLFEMARFYAPTTVFIDEIDSLASKRSENADNSRKMKAELLIQIDGVNSTTDPENQELDENGTPKLKLVTVIAATNNPWDLDDAIIRRLEKRIHIPLPNEIARSQLFTLKLKDTKTNKLDYKRQVIESSGYSGSDIENVCRDASFAPLKCVNFEGNWEEKIAYLKKMEDNQADQVITMKDQLNALKSVKPSVAKDALKKYDVWMMKQGSG